MTLTASFRLALLASLLTGCSQTPYEYEEELYLNIDGSGEFLINGSKELFAVLYSSGSSTDPAIVSADSLKLIFDSPEMEVLSIGRSTKNGRTHFHLRGRFEDLNALSKHTPFFGRRLSLERRGEELVLRGRFGGGPVSTNGMSPAFDDRRVAFRLHPPSAIHHHNSPAEVERGNIIRWERSVARHLQDAPLSLEARFERHTVLASALTLVAAAAAAVTLVVGGSLLILTRRGRQQLAAESSIVHARGRP